LVDSISHIFAG